MGHKFLALTAVALIGAMLSFGGARANVLTGPSPDITKAQNANIETVANRKKWRRQGGQRYSNGGRRYYSRQGLNGGQRYYNGGRRFYSLQSVNGGRRYYNGGRYYRRHYDNDNWNNGAWLGLGFGALPFLGGYYGGYGGYGYGGYGGYPSYYSGGGGHVSYCLNRYRSYNPRTDLFRGYDGYLHHCRSPYRY